MGYGLGVATELQAEAPREASPINPLFIEWIDFLTSAMGKRLIDCSLGYCVIVCSFVLFIDQVSPPTPPTMMVNARVRKDFRERSDGCQ